MEKLSSVCLVLLVAMVVSSGFSRPSVALPVLGDVAPRGAPDGDINVADLELLTKFTNNFLSPTIVERDLCDIAPLGGPDGELTVADVVALEQSILGLITLPAPVTVVAAPLLWGGSGISSPYFISGLTLENATVNIYRNGVLYSTTTTNSNGLFSANVDLVAGGSNAIYIKAEYNGIESAASNTLSPVLPLAIPAADMSLVTIDVDSNGYATGIAGAAGSITGGATVIVHMTDGAEYQVLANSDGSFNETFSQPGGSVASLTVSDGNGNESERTLVTAVGTLAGTFDVDPSGAASYSIPIAVPPGSAGMTPGLSLNYSSNGGNGTLGRGWSLGGLSVISRCPQTIAQDGNPGGLNLDADDRFCLDGQRLLATSGAYGADGTEYRTEIESFTKVVSYGGNGTTPDYFQAWTRSGQRIRYGFNADSGFNPQNGETLLWAADRIEDKVGNYLVFSYYEDPVTGEHYLLQVDYTANDTVGLSPYNHVLLFYEPRPDTSSGYIGGNPVINAKRLKNIQVYEGANVVRDYRLSYDTSAASAMSRLRSVTECESAAPEAACLMPAEFSWSNGAAGYTAGVTSGSTNSGYASAQVLDVNADGMQDLVVPHNGSWWINYGDAAGLLPEVNSNIPTAGSYPDYALAIDYNSDGLTDLLVPGNDGFWDLLLAGSSGLSLLTNLIPNDGYNYKPQVVDINGDGRQDLVVLANTGSGLTLHAYLNSAGGFTPAVDTGLHRNGSNTKVLDYDNDGRQDLLSAWYKGVQGCEWWLFQFDGQTYNNSLISNATQDAIGWNAGCLATASSSNNSIIVDINADGLRDLVYNRGQGEEWSVLYNTGSGLNGSLLGSGLTDNNQWYAKPVDYNHDGRTDFLVPNSADGKWHVYQSDDNSVNDIDTGLDSSGYKDARSMDANGDGMLDIVSPYNGVWNVHFRTGSIPDQLTAISNGTGISTHIDYKALSNSTVYSSGASARFPEQDLRGLLYVVTQTRIDDGIGGRYVTDYRYAGAKLHLQGRGLPGFREVTSSDLQTGITTTTTYRQDFPFTGMPVRSESTLDNQVISRTENSFAEVADINGAVGVHFPYVSESTELSYDLPDNGAQGALIKTTVTSTTYDGYGNPLTINVDTIDSGGPVYTRLTTNAYDPPDLTNWVLDRVNRTSVLHQAPGVPDITKTSGFSYYPNGLLFEEIIEPDEPTNSPLYLKTTHEYDAFGNKMKVTVTGLKNAPPSTVQESRTTETQYDSQGRFPLWTKNALGHQEFYGHDPVFGLKTSLIGPNNLPTTWTYDSFGRKLSETRADGTQTSRAYDFCNSTDCPHGGFIETVTASGSAPAIQYHDALQRVIRTGTVSLTGQPVYQDTVYDARGNVASKTRPYFAGGIAQASSYDYDALGRPIKEQAPDGGIVEYFYSGFARNTHRHHTSDDYDQYDTRINDAMDQLAYVIDAESGYQSYVYDATGNLTSTSDAAGNTTTTGYDLRGRKITMDDPDMGHWQYQYNAFGELVWQQDARGQVVTMAYDKLGRVVSRAEPEGSSTWVYDTASRGIGKLASVNYAASGHAAAYSYDSLGRLAAETSSIDTENLAMAYSYDGFSRRETVTYPTGFMVRNVYNANGRLVEVKDAANDSSYWKAMEGDAEGRVTLEDLGNGLQTVRTYDATNGSIKTISTGAGASAAVQSLAYRFDALGNLKERADTRQNLTETFIYDKLNRLTSDTLVGVGTRTYQYDALGNILNKSDYADTYSYGNNAGPHAVTEVRNGAASVATYSYDTNGNMTGGAGRSISWTSFNKALSINKGTTTLSFAYDADHNRIKQVNGTHTTYYLSPRIDAGNHYEKEIDGAGIEHKHYIYAGARSIAIYTKKSDNTGETRYLHADHLGSTDVITDESGAVVERMSFAAFGSRRHADWDNTTSVLAGIETHHGFTGHEHLDEVGIIHMNGRLYDPQLGRFLSPDAQVQYPDQTQSFNRYTYVNNNPLSYTDPSGYGFFSKLWKSIKRWVRPVLAIAASVLLWPVNYFLAGFVSGYIASGSLEGAFLGGFTAVAIAGVGSHFTALARANARGLFANPFLTTPQKFLNALAHGAVGGMSSKLSGGKFASGFLSSGFTQAVSLSGKVFFEGARVANTIKAAIIGGAASVIGGGKFTNGAQTFGFLRLFGEVADYAGRATDNLKQLACESGGRACVVDERGVLRTDGGRDVDFSLNPEREGNWLIRSGMAPEGASHTYENNKLARYFVTDVSKFHDVFNSWNYNSSTGFYMSRGAVFDSVFQLYSFAGMPVAGFATIAGYAGNAPFEQQMLYYNITRNTR
jgi:RHS repeat-associated protein